MIFFNFKFGKYFNELMYFLTYSEKVCLVIIQKSIRVLVEIADLEYPELAKVVIKMSDTTCLSVAYVRRKSSV